MPRFEPFAGVRYDETRVRLDDVIAPPYDVISPDEQADLERRSPYNAVRVELPRDEGETDRYQVAASLWHEWQEAGVIAADRAPAYYGYRMTFTDEHGAARRTTGVIGALGLEKPGGDVLPHERTMPKPKGDRLYLLRATRANLSPIWGLTLAPGLARLAGEPPAHAAVATDADAVRHELWPITDAAAIAALRDLIGGAPVVVADGHHRYETGVAFQEEDGSESSGLIMTLIVELADEELSVQAIHRLISDLPDGFDVPAALAKYFDLQPVEGVPPSGLVLHTPAGTWRMHAHPETAAAAEQDLDSSRLDVALAGLPRHELIYQHGRDLAVEEVDRGAAQAAILLRPATVKQIAETGQRRALMPPKTTFFWPKPRTGLVFRDLGKAGA